MYILESKGVIKKSDYNALDRHLRDWRLDGWIKWEQIADSSGRSILIDHRDFEDPSTFVNSRINFLRNSGKKYREYIMNKWRWHCQPKYVTFMIEKNAIAGTMSVYLKDHYVKIAQTRGNNGWGFAKRYVDRMRSELYYTDINSGERKPREEVYLGILVTGTRKGY